MIGSRDIDQLVDGKYICNRCNKIFEKYKSVAAHYDKCGSSNFFYDKHFYGESNPFYNHRHTEESKRIAGEKISKANKGRIVTDEQRENYRIANLGNTHGKGKKRTLEQRKNYSNGRLNYIKIHGLSSNNGFKSKKSIFIKDDNQIFIRSSYEAIYLLWLEWKNIKYKYEPFRLEYVNSNKLYIPDFYIIDSNLIVEIKGFLTNEISDKLLKCEETVLSKGYNWKLIVGDKIWKYYYELLNNDVNVDYLYYNIIGYKNKSNYFKWKYNNISKEVIIVNE